MTPRTRDWVSKTDMTRYARCPYAFWLLDTEQIDPADLVNEPQRQRLEEGHVFEARAVHELVEASATPVTVAPDPSQVATLLRDEITLLGTPDLHNRARKLSGRPDGIDVASGALLPVEVKAHKDVHRLDELELAFYWLLLEPYRTRTDISPAGRLILRRDGRPQLVEVAIRPHRLEEVVRLVDQVRQARRRGVRPRICGCTVCAGVRRDEVHRAAIKSKDLTLIFGIGRVYARVMEEFGVATWQDLLRCDVPEVAAAVRARGYPPVSAREVARWRQHARSYNTGRPVVFDIAADSVPVDGPFLALDLEHDPDGEPGSLIWLIGACVVDGDTQEYLVLWADSYEDEQRNLRALGALLRRRPTLRVVTWAGDGTEVPRLRAAAARSRAAFGLDLLFARHVDLYAYARRHVRLPIPSLRLREVAAYFGIPRLTDVADGRQVVLLHDQYRRTGNVGLRNRLIDYNRDDLDALVGVARQFAQLNGWAGVHGRGG